MKINKKAFFPIKLSGHTDCSLRWTISGKSIHDGTYPLIISRSYWKWPLIVDFPIGKWWFSIAMLVYQRVPFFNVFFTWSGTGLPKVTNVMTLVQIDQARSLTGNITWTNHQKLWALYFQTNPCAADGSCIPGGLNISYINVWSIEHRGYSSQNESRLNQLDSKNKNLSYLKFLAMNYLGI